MRTRECMHRRPKSGQLGESQQNGKRGDLTRATLENQRHAMLSGHRRHTDGTKNWCQHNAHLAQFLQPSSEHFDTEHGRTETIISMYTKATRQDHENAVPSGTQNCPSLEFHWCLGHAVPSGTQNNSPVVRSGPRPCSLVASLTHPGQVSRVHLFLPRGVTPVI